MVRKLFFAIYHNGLKANSPKRGRKQTKWLIFLLAPIVTQIRPERPSADEIEVSFFGPGFGESIVIHAGDDNWIVVDSCIDAPSSRPAALAYLEEIGVDPSTAVKLILTTHWHDDHIGGMSELVKTCLSAKFACSMALTRREFIEVATVYTTRPLVRGTSGVTEIRETFETLKKRHQVPVHATADRPLFRVRREPAGDVTWEVTTATDMFDIPARPCGRIAQSIG